MAIDTVMTKEEFRRHYFRYSQKYQHYFLCRCPVCDAPENELLAHYSGSFSHHGSISMGRVTGTKCRRCRIVSNHLTEDGYIRRL